MTTCQHCLPENRADIADGLTFCAYCGESFDHGCTWLIEVPSGHPEPDSYADTVKVVECGAPVTIDTYTVDGVALEGFHCEHGHKHTPIEISWTDPEFFGDE